ncbi:hypothetical protein A359_01050 [secondary endosymbiont of Ctenarytaina eucalypti]|uniref:Uncharacterized protein n=1 Tax=secondary endosymbiont of Ctenarytaina eucalypti TaxID=1199245 RepID=J3Z2T1_9ENTR|nr:hypothetical protein A359_01050 [secondary endosymbiont of Ctenarytaina eucalypti]
MYISYIRLIWHVTAVRITGFIFLLNYMFCMIQHFTKIFEIFVYNDYNLNVTNILLTVSLMM